MSHHNTITNAISSLDYPALQTFFTINPYPTLNPGEQRSLSAHFIITALSSPNFLPNAFHSSSILAVIDVCLANLPPSVEGAADNTLRHQLFEFKVEEGDYATAARILSGMRMEDAEGSVYYVKPLDRCDVYVKVAECYLEEDLTVEAEGAVGKAGGVIESSGIGFASKNDGQEDGEDDNAASKVISEEQQKTITILLRYKSTHARILDANRKFLQASMKYYDLSTAYLHTDAIDADELVIMLGKAVTCAILSPNSAQRQRLVVCVLVDELLP